jgi:hypothetical protein
LTTLTCKVCKEVKDAAEFPKASITKSGRAGTCKECTAAKWKTVRLERSAELYKMRGQCCEKCGDFHDNPAFFDWHHIDPTTKKYEVKTMICSKWDKVLEEAEKCLMLCPNCHRKEHLNELQ